jgi:hypothetical protein
MDKDQRWQTGQPDSRNYDIPQGTDQVPDDDGYACFRAEYKWSDTLTTRLGGHSFYADESDTFFGQLEDNRNLYVAICRWF